MEQIKESNLNRILSHMSDKDIAMITAFRTDPELGLTKRQNQKRNKKLEDKLNKMGYRGYTKVVGYWNETPEDKNSKAVAEESYVVLNVGSSFSDFVEDMVLLCLDVDDNDFDQQAVMVWSHEEQKAYLYDNTGELISTFNDFSIDTMSKGWTNIKGHNITFVEEAITDIPFGFSENFNEGGNWLTAMGYDSERQKHRR